MRVPRRRFLLTSTLALLGGCSTDAGDGDGVTTDGSKSGGTTGPAPTRGGSTTGAGTTDVGTTETGTTARPPEPVRVGFTGDVMLARHVETTHAGEPPGSVWGDLHGRLRSLDGLFVNLECCLSERGDRFPDRTYYFRADPDWAIPALRAAGVTWTSLANNHVLDYGPTALADTVEHLSNAGIATSGAGEDVRAAFEPATVSVGGVDLALVSFADHYREYAAGPASAGTAYVEMDVDDAETRRTVETALERARATDPDHLVASVHWGPNWAVRPAERYREFAHFLVEAGVDLVHGHSAHVVQGVETHQGSPILHDAGDFVDDYVVKPDLHNDRSFLFEVALSAEALLELRLVPVEIDVGVSRAGPAAASWARERMRDLSSPFGTAFERDGETLVLPLADG